MGSTARLYKKKKRTGLLQMGLNSHHATLNQRDLYLEIAHQDVTDFLDGAYPLNKIFCIYFADDVEGVFFDLEAEAAGSNKLSVKPFKKRRL